MWISIAAVALVLTWLLVQLSRQGASAQIAQARSLAEVSCETMGAGAARLREAIVSANAVNAPVPLTSSAAHAVIDLALRDEPGMEGGFWQRGRGVFAYAFPTYDGTGIKRDPPSAELERIASTAQRALDSNSLISEVRPGLREAVVFAACPIKGEADGVAAWTLKRTPVIGADVLTRLIVALSLLLGFVVVSGGWLGWMLTRWRRQSAQLMLQLAQAEQLATLGRVAAGLAHEIRNPLGAMRMKAENALAATSDVREARVAGALESVLSQTARLEALVSSLLALTQPFRVERKVLDVGNWLEARRQAHADAAARSGIRIVLGAGSVSAPDGASGKMPPAAFDPQQMARAFDNLLLNALAHTEAGGTIELGAQRLPDGALQLWVADDGAGIPAELRDGIFEPFTTARPGGTGLGLTLVREIVHAHGGKITLVATPRGARFEMELPWHAS